MGELKDNQNEKAKVKGIDDALNTGTEIKTLKGDEAMEEINKLCEQAINNKKFEKSKTSNDKKSDEKKEANKQSSILISLMGDVSIYRTSLDILYATIMINGHEENWPIKSESFKSIMVSRFFEIEKKPPSKLAVQEAKEYFEAISFKSNIADVWVRIAKHEDAIYYDIGDEEWKSVRITKDGWEIVEKTPVKFIRSKGLSKNVYPIKGGSISQLRKFINIGENEDKWILYLATIVGAFNPKGPHAITYFKGGNGSAKTTATKITKMLIDPNASFVKTFPHNERDLFMTASKSWAICFDNISKISNEMSDALCRLSTGAGISSRKLYTDDEENIIDIKRPIFLNGISEVVIREDLLSRLIEIEFLPVTEENRKTETEFWNEFEKERPIIFGAILDIVSACLRNSSNVCISKLPRMADFATWVTAGFSGIGISQQKFMEAYFKNITDLTYNTLESNVVVQAIIEFMSIGNHWKGSCTELYGELNQSTPELLKRCIDYPKSPRQLSHQLRFIAQSLLCLGIKINFGSREPGSGKRLIHIHRDDKKLSQMSQSEFKSVNSVENDICDNCDDSDNNTDILEGMVE